LPQSGIAASMHSHSGIAASMLSRIHSGIAASMHSHSDIAAMMHHCRQY
jgi:hypothetical protein